MRNTKITWNLNVSNTQVVVTVGRWEINEFHEECSESEVEVTIRRDLDSSYSYKGMEETHCSRVDDGILWYLTTTRPLTYTEFFALKDTGTLPAHVEYEVVLGGGSYFRAGTSAKTLRKALKSDAESNLGHMTYCIPCKEGYQMWSDKLTAQEIDANGHL